MGQRGKLPELKREQPEAMNDLSAPLWLQGLSLQFWTKHASHLAKNNILNFETSDSFALCCELWGRIREQHESSRSYLDTVKAFNSLAKIFRLQPTDKIGQPVTRHEEKSEFDF